MGLSFPRSMGKNVSKNRSKNLSCKYDKKLFDQTKQSAADAFRTVSKRAIQKIAETTGYLLSSKIANRNSKVSIDR